MTEAEKSIGFLYNNIDYNNTIIDFQIRAVEDNARGSWGPQFKRNTNFCQLRANDNNSTWQTAVEQQGISLKFVGDTKNSEIQMVEH